MSTNKIGTFREWLNESKASIIIDWASEVKGLDKSLSKEYKIDIKDTGKMEATVSGDKKKIIAFLTSADYNKSLDDAKDEFPELF